MRDLILKQNAALSASGSMGMTIGSTVRNTFGNDQEILDAEQSNDTVDLLKDILSTLKTSIGIERGIENSIIKLSKSPSPEDIRESKSLQEKQLIALEDIFNSLSISKPQSASIDKNIIQRLSSIMTDLSSNIKMLTATIGVLMLALGKGFGIPGRTLPGPAQQRRLPPATPGPIDKDGKPTRKDKTGKPIKKPSMAGRIGGGLAIASGLGLSIAAGKVEDESTASTLDTLGTVATVAGTGAILLDEKRRRDAEKLKNDTEDVKTKKEETVKKEEVKKEAETAKKEEVKKVNAEKVETTKEEKVAKKPSKIKGILGKVGKFTPAGILGGVALDVATEKAEESGNVKTAAGLGVASEALTYGSLGATLGSVIPIVGTIAGGVAGTAFGVGKGLYERSGTLFSNKQTAALGTSGVMMSGDKVIATTVTNEAAKATPKNQEPVIISAPTTNTVNNKQTLVSPQPVRNPDATFNQYMNKSRVIV